MKRAVLAVLAGVLILAGCGSTGSGGSADSAVPAGGWPQPADGRVGESMCALLTSGDYARFGHHRAPDVSPQVDVKTNALDCRSGTADEMTLALEPTAAYARYVFAAGLREHRAQVHSVPVTGVVGAADESWFDRWGMGSDDGAHELRVRRGSLIVGLTLSGAGHEKDPRAALVGLADLVLRRLPHVGAKDTGTTHRLTYQVTGADRAASVTFDDYAAANENGSAENARLPWLREVPVAFGPSVSPDPPVVDVNATTTTAKVGCRIILDDVVIAEEKPHEGYVACHGQWPESPENSEPAVFRE